MHAVAAALALAALLLIGPASQPVLQPAGIAAQDASIHGYGDSDATCREWTDGCRTCVRGENGDPMCPNIGIACQPAAITCAKRMDAAR